jgi:Flp pilus assembly protein TadD
VSLLLKALQQADRGSNLTLEPMEERPAETPAAPPASAKAAAALMFEKQARSEKRRLMVLLGLLVAVVLGMGIYFYLAVFMPWIFLPKPPATSVAGTAVLAAPAATVTADVLSPAVTPLAPTPEAIPLRAVPDAAPSALLDRPAGTIKPLNPRNPVASPVAKDRNIQISGGSAAANAVPSAGGVMAAYRLLQEGRLDEARRTYEALRAVEPRNADVLLGLGLIAQRQGRTEDAAQLYLKALDVDPKNAFAQASLSSLIAHTDPVAAEGKLKGLIAQQPSAFLFFRLGNIYATQGRWNEAQMAYFEAQRLETDSPDYAFNLAVSLEHINQPRVALDYYQRALKLSQTKTAAFDLAQLKSRIQQLSGTK